MIPPTFLALLVGFEMDDFFKTFREFEGDVAPFDVIGRIPRQNVRPQVLLAAKGVQSLNLSKWITCLMILRMRWFIFEVHRHGPRS